jgi:hypothetical protein
MLWSYFHKIAGGVPPSEEARFKGEFVPPEELIAADNAWYAERERFEQANAENFAKAAQLDELERKVNDLTEEMLASDFVMIPVDDLTEAETASVLESLGGGPLFLFLGYSQTAGAAQTVQGSPQQMFTAGPVRVVSLGNPGEVPPEARVVAGIVRQGLTSFFENPTTVQHYLPEGMRRAYIAAPLRLGPAAWGIATENYTAAVVNTNPGFQRLIAPLGGANAPDQVIRYRAPGYAFTDIYPNSSWGRAHYGRIYLTPARTGIEAFGIVYEPIPPAILWGGSLSAPSGYTPRTVEAIRTEPVIRPPARSGRR